jgi:hypothetical protein
MPTPWDAAIRNQQIKDLGVFAGPDLKKAPAWGLNLFHRILDEFNRLSSLNKLGVTVSESLLKGANVQIEVSTGTHKFTERDGTEHTGSLPSTGLNIVGVSHVVTQVGEIQQVFIFVPIRPSIAGAGSRGIGTGAKLALALHEMLHAVGLNESDPGHFTGLDDPDIYMSGAQFEGHFPPDGNPGDRFNLGHGRFAPPLFITARTASLVQRNWP